MKWALLEQGLYLASMRGTFCTMSFTFSAVSLILSLAAVIII